MFDMFDLPPGLQEQARTVLLTVLFIFAGKGLLSLMTASTTRGRAAEPAKEPGSREDSAQEAKDRHTEQGSWLTSTEAKLVEGIKEVLKKITNTDFASSQLYTQKVEQLGSEVLAALHFTQGELSEVKEALTRTGEEVHTIKEMCERPLMATPPQYRAPVFGHGAREVPAGFFKDTWIPSMWKPAIVAAANYDGTYDLQFEMNHGPYRERRTPKIPEGMGTARKKPKAKTPKPNICLQLGTGTARTKGHKRTPTLSLRKNERFKDFGADHMPASFRLFEEMNYQQSVPPSNIRMVGFIDRISDMHDPDATQDWGAPGSFFRRAVTLNLVLSSETPSPGWNISGSKREPKTFRCASAKRLDDFARRFLFSYRWVPTEDGDLRFEPVPNASQE
eukprot:s938_g19.t1